LFTEKISAGLQKKENAILLDWQN